MWPRIEARAGYRAHRRNTPLLALLLSLAATACGSAPSSRETTPTAAVDAPSLADSESTSAEPEALSPEHHTEVGTFDIHVCEWKNLPFHFMWVFITDRHAEIQRIEVFDPEDSSLGVMDLERYRLIAKDEGYEKRVLITRTPIRKGAQDGWYSARVTLRDGRVLLARDRVRIRSMRIVEAGLNPPHEDEELPVTTTLSWEPIEDATYYRVFISDSWSGEAILESPPISDPRITLPEGLLEPGGTYTWRVHARDGGEDPDYGAFNHGSLSPVYRFSTAEMSAAYSSAADSPADGASAEGASNAKP